MSSRTRQQQRTGGVLADTQSDIMRIISVTATTAQPTAVSARCARSTTGRFLTPVVERAGHATDVSTRCARSSTGRFLIPVVERAAQVNDRKVPHLGR